MAGILCVSVLGLTPSQASAFPDEPYSLDEGSKAHTERFHILGELGLFAGNLEDGQKRVLVSPLIEMRLQLTYSVLFQVMWGMSYANVDNDQGESDNTFRIGNPYAAFHYQGKKNQFSYRVGVGVTIPAATLPDDNAERIVAQTAYTLAAALRGNTGFWLWDAHSVSVIIPIAFERRKPSGFLWGMYLDTGVMIKINDKNNRNKKNDFIMQTVGMMGYQATDWLRVGSRVSFVLIPKFSGAKTQLAAEPFLRFGNENAFGAIRLNVNLDNPWGFSFDKGQVWGLRVAGGAAF